MAIRIASVLLSVAGLLALVLGLLAWTGTASNLMQMHMLLGFLTVGALWVVGIGQAFFRGGSPVLAVGAIIIGALTVIFGMTHPSLMEGELHWIIQVLHLTLGVITIGLGHIAAARHKRAIKDKG
jgi:hypothetical protein